MATDGHIRRKRETAAGDSLSDNTETGQQKMALVHQGLSLLDHGSRHIDDDDDFNPMDEELAVVVFGQQSMDVDDSDDPDGIIDCVPLRGVKIDYVPLRIVRPDVDESDDPDGKIDCVPLTGGKIDYAPLRIVRPENLENGKENYPGFRNKEEAKKTRQKETSTVLTYRRKRGRPDGSKSAKGKTAQKTALFDSSSGRSSHSKGDKDDDFEPPTPMWKRARLAGPKYAKSKMEQKPALVHSSREEKRDNEEDFKPERKRGRPVGSKSAKRKTEQKPLFFDSSSSEGTKDMDDDFDPEVSDDDDDDDDDYRHKKCARVKGTALKRAMELEKKLPAEDPSLVKCMKHSQVVKGFWLGFPASFCRNHLPEHDSSIMLEDGEGKIYETQYIAYKNGLSGGWQRFAKQQHLKVNDAMVFQLVKPTTFKVYILRENKLTATDGALGLLCLDTSMENRTSKKKQSFDKYTKSKEAEIGGMSSPGPDIDNFAAGKSFVNFKIVIGDGLIVLPDHLRRTYYELCQAQKAFVHRHLKGISLELATAVIVETTNIAESIRASSTTSLKDIEGWKKTLESFKTLGMDVTLIFKRVDDLFGLVSAPLVMPEEYEVVKRERDRVAEQVRHLESRVSILKGGLKELDVENEKMVEASAKKKEQAVRELATAPW